MAITHIQTKTATAANNGTVTFDATPNDGDLLVFGFTGVSSSASEITTDFASTTIFSTTEGHSRAMFYRIASSEASASYSFTCNANGSGTRMIGWRFSCDTAPSLKLETEFTTYAGVTSVSDSIAASVDEAVIAWFNTDNNGTKTWNSGWSNAVTAGRDVGNHKISAGATETAEVTFDNSTSTAGGYNLIVFTEAAAGPAITSSPATLEPGESFQIVIDTPVTFDGVTLGGVAQTVSNSNTDGGVTTINCVCVQGNLKFNEHTLAVTNVEEI